MKTSCTQNPAIQSIIGTVLACWCQLSISGELNTDPPPSHQIELEVSNVSACSDKSGTSISIDPGSEFVLIVHGCYPSNGRFRSLAEVFRIHGQQAYCFNYNDRQSLRKSATTLAQSISRISPHLENPKITLIGHSQGGLVARRALVKLRKEDTGVSNKVFDLVTISAPFGGIKASAHCGSRTLAWLTIGLTKPICWMVTGSKYRDIPPNSKFITAPGEPVASLQRHLNIVTDERHSCRKWNRSGKCVEDDFVFSIEEQIQPSIQADPEFISVTIEAGHVEIVGNGRSVPEKLVKTLLENGVLKVTPEYTQDELARLLEETYISKNVSERYSVSESNLQSQIFSQRR